jgi:hypothetical protein
MLRMYKEYSANYNEALKSLQVICRKSAWLKLCQKAMNAPQAQVSQVCLHLTSYLIMPVQRVPRYILLLNDLLKHTPETSPDHPQIKKALELLNEIATELNQYMKRAEMGSKALEIQQHLVGKVPSLLEAHRVYVMDGEVQKITSRFVRKCTIFMFSDLILYAHTRVGSFYKLQGVVELGVTWARELEDTSSYQNIFQIIGPSKTWTFFVAERSMRDKWVAEIMRCSDAIAERDPSVLTRRPQVNVKVRSGVWHGRSQSHRIKFDKEYADHVGTQPEDQEAAPLLTSNQKHKAAKKKGCCCTIL